jgi:hypothetical protein
MNPHNRKKKEAILCGVCVGEEGGRGWARHAYAARWENAPSSSPVAAAAEEDDEDDDDDEEDEADAGCLRDSSVCAVPRSPTHRSVKVCTVSEACVQASDSSKI